MTVYFRGLGYKGRFGNQLWQVAATIGLAHRQGEQPELEASWDYRPFLSIPDEFFVDEPSGIDAESLVPHLSVQAKPYLQDFSLFSDIADEIRSWFQPSERALKLMSDLPGPLPGDRQIALHVRRGDNAYTNPPDTFPLPTPRYWREALERMDVDCPLWVFSDDPEWCNTYLRYEIPREFVLVEGNPQRPPDSAPEDYWSTEAMDWIDLQLMARCSEHILANSTYSWWGAFLAGNESACYPIPWYGRKIAVHTDFELMIPKGWVGIAC